MNDFIGYARVSSKEQNESRQVQALLNYGVLQKNIFVDTKSGKDFNRTSYKCMLKKLKKGKTLVVTSIDRLGRNYEEIIEQWRFIIKEVGADIIVLDIPLLDTTIHKDLIGTLISDIVLQLLSFVAQSERENIKQRQAEGIAIAKANGVKFGRPKKYDINKYLSVLDKYHNKEISAEMAIKQINCSKATFYRLKNNYIIMHKNS